MTCQHCQTWNLDDDHRCRRCGRRLKSTPSRISPNTYPIAATATARAYEPHPELGSEQGQASPNTAVQDGQQQLFSTAIADPRVIPFDSLTSQTEKEAIRARAADLSRPAPLKSSKVEVRHARARKSRSSSEQRRLEFLGQEEVLAPPRSNIICNAPVAPLSLRAQAALLDGLLMIAGCVVGAFLFRFAGGTVRFDRHILPFFGLALITVPFFYKLLWTYIGRDTIGMSTLGLHLVDFDGNPPSRARRYQRLLGGFVSTAAAGVGMIWALLDEDSLTWHDHMSSTFPTIASEN